MSLAEKKAMLLKEIENADEVFAEQLIDFIYSYKSKSYPFSATEIAEFDRRREAYLKKPEDVLKAEESLHRLRNRLAK